ncbi:MmgE/PrpD family protein [Paracoccus pantotrophus]|uniref:MmgE/PrpD family protein n=1 Tax=Paracoccus pantotrophus TaxID=82367 RepID=UPI0009448F9B|nr:MmgE/PrpD family protein [Paracoccus pantotrophus]MDF3855756.1 MmgE/PrpD family protein [Paracoccus pantotrophus]
MHAIDKLAALIVDRPTGFLAASTREKCSLLVADLMAASAGGINSQLATAARATARDIYGDGNATVWLSGERASIAGAAMANAAAASALDIDDGHRRAAGHPGAGIIPAVIAVAQALDLPDESIFEAIVLGYDVGLRIAASRPMATIETYCSGRWVNYGVAAATGRLLELDGRELAHAMAIAGAEGPISVPAGGTNYQSTTVKEVIPPAVVAGLTGAFRARAGATGPRDLLDSPDRFAPEILIGGFGDRWWIEDCYIKPYACCRWIHGAIDAILELRQPGTKIRSLRIETFPQGLRLANERAPQSLEGAQYSYYFSCALAALHGAGAMQPINSTRLRDREVIELAGAIELVPHDDFAEAFPERTPSRVFMDQGSGMQSVTVHHPLGDVANPMSYVQVTRKLQGLAADSIGQVRFETLQSALDGLDRHGFRPLMAALQSENS